VRSEFAACFEDEDYLFNFERKTEKMEAIFKIQPTEFNERLFHQIKKMVEGRPVTITISTEIDETEYLNVYPANRKHLLEGIVSEPTIVFTPDEFEKHVESLLTQS
jgi:hypothetical protein